MTVVRRGGEDRGSVAVFAALAGLALLLMTGLVVDGARVLRSSARAEQVAAEAARAAAQAADTRSGAAVRIDQPAATRAARAYLDAAGVEGRIQVTGPGAVEVTTTVHGRYLILGLLGRSGYTRYGTARVTLAVGGSPP